MTAEQFVYWLQGFVEICSPHKRGIGGAEEQAHVWQEIKNHLDLVLTKKTPLQESKDKLPPTAAAQMDWTKQETLVATTLPVVGTLKC